VTGGFDVLVKRHGISALASMYTGSALYQCGDISDGSAISECRKEQMIFKPRSL